MVNCGILVVQSSQNSPIYSKQDDLNYVVFNDTLNTFYLWLHGIAVGMVWVILGMLFMTELFMHAYYGHRL